MRFAKSQYDGVERLVVRSRASNLVRSNLAASATCWVRSGRTMVDQTHLAAHPKTNGRTCSAVLNPGLLTKM